MAEKRIEDFINETLTGDAQKNALEFATFLQENEIATPDGEGYWELNYKDKEVCILFINGEADIPGPWTIWSDESEYGELADFSIDEKTKEIAWKFANKCGSCGQDCSPGKTKTIFGKEFENICGSTFMFTNPDAETLEGVKKLVEMRKHVITN